MKPSLIDFVFLAFALTLTPNLPAQPASDSVAAPVFGNASGPAPAPNAGLLNDWLREQCVCFTPWDFGGQFRARLEVKDY
ncbi:MAG TPA: hypothetical protein VN281_04715, partial [Verrucomicrobiae bacterium]|nr:hypothetical protein [Verrucomicrobiae bacterium]